MLHSTKNHKYDIGSTNDLENRPKYHNYVATPSSRSGALIWGIVHKDILSDKSSARKRKLNIKRKNK
ncbi:hypothetical protein [Cecembia sp.]|uniref:hypothetical protein n=1 Tax=Cecembia sp. TaxID=1898110 RepID=UPI00344D35E4